MQHLEHLAGVVLWVSVGVLLIDLSLVAFVFYRRVARRRYFERKDAAKAGFSPVAEQFMSGQASLDEALPVLQRQRTSAERDAVQQLLLTGINAANRADVTEALVQLGYVRRWTDTVFGKRRGRELLLHLTKGEPLPPFRPSLRHRLPAIFSLRLFAVSRALSLMYLGKLSPRFVRVFTSEALHDPAPIVQHINVSAMGHNRDEQTLVALVHQLKAAVEKNVDLPVRWIKTALVRYPKRDLGHLAPFLGDPSPRFRFLLVDSIREICRREATMENVEPVPQPIREWLLHDAVHDPSPDVRARSAQVIRYLHEPAATRALAGLLDDDSEFVRLHAVRACADPYYDSLLDQVLAKIGDLRWRVREAAVATVSSFENKGLKLLSRNFVESSDRYASEQIGDELQRSGVVGEIVLALGGAKEDAELARRTCSKLVAIGKTSHLTELFGAEQDDTIRAALADVLIAAPTPQLTAILETAAAASDDPLRSQAQDLLQQVAAVRAAAAGGQSA